MIGSIGWAANQNKYKVLNKTQLNFSHNQTGETRYLKKGKREKFSVSMLGERDFTGFSCSQASVWDKRLRMKPTEFHQMNMKSKRMVVKDQYYKMLHGKFSEKMSSQKSVSGSSIGSDSLSN